MSQFLGPIHEWMYGKIKYQDQMTNYICEKAKEYGWNEQLKETLAKAYGELTPGNLEDIIDVMNIHGWLSSHVDMVESHFAQAIHSLLEEDKTRLEALKQVCFEAGKEVGSQFDKTTSCKECYDIVRGHLVDGMPCDGGLRIESDEEDQIIWSVSEQVHEPYWTERQESLDTFFELRDAWLRGFFDEKVVQYTQLATNTFCVKEG